MVGISSVFESSKASGFNYKNESRKVERKLARSMNDEEKLIVLDALRQVILTSNHPDNFADRFTNSVNVFSIIVHASTFKTKKKELVKAEGVSEAVEQLREYTQLFFNRTKENDMSTEEFVGMMKLGLKDIGYDDGKKKRLKTYTPQVDSNDIPDEDVFEEHNTEDDGED
jgi:hypothetical protein